jgi:hypothetical protein
MRRAPAPLLALGLGVAVALALVSCGGEDAQLLPGETAREITANLDAVQQLADEGDCAGAEAAAQQVSEQVEGLSGVDPKLKRALEAGAARLSEAIAGCEEEVEAVAPDLTAPETEPPPAEAEQEAKEREKEEKEAAKEREKEEKEAEKEEAKQEEEPSLPPQAEGEGKGLEEGGGPPPSEEAQGEAPAGGVAAGSPAEGE